MKRFPMSIASTVLICGNPARRSGLMATRRTTDGNDLYWLRTEFVGATGKVFQALGIAAPAKVRRRAWRGTGSSEVCGATPAVPIRNPVRPR